MLKFLLPYFVTNEKSISFFSLLIFSAYYFQCQAQTQTPTSRIGLEANYSASAFLFKNQNSDYIAERSVNNLNVMSDELFGMYLHLPFKNSNYNLKVGIAYDKQSYSFGNNSEVFWGLLFPIGTPTLFQINRVHFWTGYLTLPVILQQKHTNKRGNASFLLSYGIETGVNVYKDSFLSFGNDTLSQTSRAALETMVGDYYKKSVSTLSFKARGALGLELKLFQKLYFLTNFNMGYYINSPNSSIMRTPIGVGVDFGLKYDLSSK